MSNTPIDGNFRKTVREWFTLPFEWRIPVYQRHYAWNAEDDSGPIYLFWQTIKEQTESRLVGEVSSQHYLGAVLVDNKTNRGAVDGIIRYDVVDGQQRLTTIQIALLALIRAADEYQLSDEIKKELESFLFLNENTPRLRPTNFDRKQFRMVFCNAWDDTIEVDSQNVSGENAGKSKIVATFEFFQAAYKNLVESYSQKDAREIIFAIKDTLLKGFDIVLIVLRETDDAQRVFESLNSYAKPLTAFDLIRNNVFHRAAAQEEGMDERLFNQQKWQRFETPFWEEPADRSNSHIEAYIARMLVCS